MTDENIIFDITRETDVFKVFFISARENTTCICDW